MIDKEDARRIVAEFINEGCTTEDGSTPVVVESETLDRDFGWVFFYQSREFLETGDFGTQLVGNAPIIVDRSDGSLHVTGTARPVEHYIQEYERELTGDHSYTRTELQKIRDSEFPEYGPLCPKCRAHIPQFADLPAPAADRIRALRRESSSTTAMAELRKLTGCSLRWAKIWVLHNGGPPWPTDTDTRPCPCPLCGKPLRTARAKQCRHCLMQWRNKGRPRPL